MRIRFLVLFALLAQVAINFQAPLFHNAATESSNVLQGTSFPFSDDFETGTFSSNWKPFSSDNGIAVINSDYPHSGAQSVFLGQKVAGAASASLALAIDLSGQTDVFLDFWWRASGTSYDTIDTVAISADDGVTWKEVDRLSKDSQSYSHELINIASAAAANGLALNNTFQIRFLYAPANYNSTRANDGLILDDIRLDRRATAITSFPFSVDDFEAATFQKGMYPQSTSNGTAQITMDYAHSGVRSVFLGQKAAGAASASLVLAIDLSGQTDVFLDFWWRASGTSYDTIDTVAISADDGVTWKEVDRLSKDSQSYSHELINIASAAAANGLALNNTFQIRFLYAPANYNSTRANDGLILDDIRLDRRATAIASFPIPADDFEAAAFQKGLYPQSTSNGTAQITTDYAHSGVRSVFLGQKVAGAASASLVLAIDLAGRTDVFLDFWWRASGTSYDAVDTVAISADDGVTWKQIRLLDRTLQRYRHEVINIADEAAANGLTLNNKFQIRFLCAPANYNSTRANDGIAIDDLRIGSTDPNPRIYISLLRR